MKIKKSFILFFIIMWGLASLGAPRALAQDVDEVTIYDMGTAYSEKITQPDSLSRSYQIPQTGEKMSYKIKSGIDCVDVSKDGLVTTHRQYWKRGDDYSYSVEEWEGYDYYTITSGDAEIAVTSETGTRLLTVHVKNYADVYTENVMDEYIRQNITEGMSNDEIAVAIVKFAARYDYDYRYQGSTEMVVFGGGSCWASVNTIIRLAKRMGYDAWGRNGNKDPGAGSGHRDAMVEINGNYYELEAGYDSEKDEEGYRPYDVYWRSTLFSFYTTREGNAIIYQYDGKTSEGEVEIPAEIGGHKVISIAGSALAGEGFTKVILPEGLEKIGDYAFSGCSNLREITIPSSVTQIGNGAFRLCDAMEDFSIDKDNANYYLEDNLIYTKDAETIVEAVGQIDENIQVPSTVKNIQSYAFYDCKNLKSIEIPSSVKEIGEKSFSWCIHLNQIKLNEGLEIIGAYGFQENHNLSVLRLPASVKEIRAGAFSWDYKLQKIYFKGDAPSFGSELEGKYYDEVFEGCREGLEAYIPEGNATWDDTACTDHDGTDVTWKKWSTANYESIENAEIILDPGSYEYTGSEVHPDKITVRLDGKTLTEGEDYLVVYPNDEEYIIGKAAFLIAGVGDYTGVIEAHYTIDKAEREITFSTENTQVNVGKTLRGPYVYPSSLAFYESEDPSVVTVDQQGNITGVSEGTAWINITIPETENYKPWQQKVLITVTDQGEIETPEPGNDHTSYPDSSRRPAAEVTHSPKPTVSAGPAVSSKPSVTATVRPGGNWGTWTQVFGSPRPGATVSPFPKASTKPEPDNAEQTPKKNSAVVGKKIVSKNVRYRITGKNMAAFAGVVKQQKNIKIPAVVTYGGRSYKVTAVMANACIGNKKLVRLIVGKNVTKIGAKAFWKCKKLKKVIYQGRKPKKKNIGNKAFAGTRITKRK